ncbi:1-acyl-sn-glycerol-3-phosphate acyltransferase [Clostridia bacterium]|nr:1-acyl-sn-glycerol-3-phosphate acyltransferase [Clostridia bacterium]
MIRTIVWFLYFGILLLGTLPNLLRVKSYQAQGQIEKHDLLTNKVTTRWARALLRAAGARVVVQGEKKIPANQPVVFVSNHQGNFDIPLLLGYIPTPKAFVAKIELSKFPIVSNWMKQMKCVFMDRADIRQSLSVINQSANYLKQGYSTVLFPEGTRSKGNKMGEFKAGSLKLAQKAGVPIVPVAINGSYKLMEQQGFKIKPATVTITILDPIATKDLSKDQMRDLPEKIQSMIEQKLIENA